MTSTQKKWAWIGAGSATVAELVYVAYYLGLFARL